MPYQHKEYPKLLYKQGELRPMRVDSVEQEKDFLSRGWQTGHIEPPPPPTPKTEVELALEQRDNSHRAFVKALKEKHADALGIVSAELKVMTAKYDAVLVAHSELSVERLALLNKLAEIEKQTSALVGELNTANHRADDLVAQLGAAHQEIAELKKKAPIAPKFPTHKQKEE